MRIKTKYEAGVKKVRVTGSVQTFVSVTICLIQLDPHDSLHSILHVDSFTSDFFCIDLLRFILARSKNLKFI